MRSVYTEHRNWKFQQVLQDLSCNWSVWQAYTVDCDRTFELAGGLGHSLEQSTIEISHQQAGVYITVATTPVMISR